MFYLTAADFYTILLTIIVLLATLTLVGLTLSPHSQFLSSHINRLLYGNMKAKPHSGKDRPH